MKAALQNNLLPYAVKKGKLNPFNLLFFLLLLIWCTGIFFPVLNPHNEHGLTSYFLKQNYSLVCHQQEAKTITIGGNSLLVCARCTGIYLGALAAAIAFLLYSGKINISIKFLIATSTLLLCDVIFSSSGLYEYSKIAALFTGFVFGSAICFLIIPLLQKNLFNKVQV